MSRTGGHDGEFGRCRVGHAGRVIRPVGTEQAGVTSEGQELLDAGLRELRDLEVRQSRAGVDRVDGALRYRGAIAVDGDDRIARDEELRSDEAAGLLVSDDEVVRTGRVGDGSGSGARCRATRWAGGPCRGARPEEQGARDEHCEHH